VYRLQQAPVRAAERIFVLGLAPDWFAAEPDGDFWFAGRDREALSEDFTVRSSVQVSSERLAVFRAWLGGAREVFILDCGYGSSGRERESLLPALRQAVEGLPAWQACVPEAPEERGAHPRFSRGFGPPAGNPPQQVRLGPGTTGARPLTATALDHYSSCPFKALALDRWKLADLREPELELWPEVRGLILHEAARLLVASREASGFGLSPREALERAWEGSRVRGFAGGSRSRTHAKLRMERILETFAEKEQEYAARSGARPVVLESEPLRMEAGDSGVEIVGRPDRIDEAAAGLFVIDYKTSSGLPNGAEMLERGYRLQLPFYALAAARRHARPVLGAQFIELSPRGSRSSGVLFRRYNGKEPGKLTHSRSRSVLDIEPEEAWKRFEGHIERQARAYACGEFDALPRKSTECQRCRVSDLCGRRRLGVAEEEEDIEGGA
jgi:RecB family exonuclease